MHFLFSFLYYFFSLFICCCLFFHSSIVVNAMHWHLRLQTRQTRTPQARHAIFVLIGFSFGVCGPQPNETIAEPIFTFLHIESNLYSAKSSLNALISVLIKTITDFSKLGKLGSQVNAISMKAIEIKNARQGEMNA